MSPLKKYKLGVLLFPGFELLDVFGPLEMFGSLPEQFDIILIAEKKGLVESTQKVSVSAPYAFSDDVQFDILFVPGGMGTRTEVNNAQLIDWIEKKSSCVKLILSVCTGAALLAKTTVLNGLKATTNKRAFDWVIAQNSAVQWQKKARWVDAGNVITSSGIAAGTDMSLHVIEKLFGKAVAQSVCEKTEYIWNQRADEDPFAVQ